MLFARFRGGCRCRGVFSLLFLAVVVSMVAGCGGRNYHYRTGFEQFEKWQPVGEAAESSVVDINIKAHWFDPSSGTLNVRMDQEFEVEKSLYKQKARYERVSRDPNLFHLMNPFSWLLVCPDLPWRCFGKSGDWYLSSKYGDLEHVKVLETRRKSGPLVYSDAFARAQLIAIAENGEEWKKKTRAPIKEGQSVVRVRELALESPFRPDQLNVDFSVWANHHRRDLRIRLTDEQVASLNLFSERWLTPPELFKHHMVSIASCMEASDYQCVVARFFKIQDMDIEKPKSFYFYFGKALKQVGDEENARKALNNYLKDSRNRKYRSQAKALL